MWSTAVRRVAWIFKNISVLLLGCLDVDILEPWMITCSSQLASGRAVRAAPKAKLLLSLLPFRLGTAIRGTKSFTWGQGRGSPDGWFMMPVGLGT